MNSPTPFDDFFAKLEAALAVPCPREPHADAAGSQETRIVWARSGDPRPEQIPYQRAREKVIGRLAHPWMATIYASSDLEVSTLLASLWAKVDSFFGPPRGAPALGNPGDADYMPERLGYQFAPGSVGVLGDDAAAASWSCTVQVTLYQPVASEVRRVATVEHVTLSTTAPAGGGAVNPASITWP